MDTINPDHSCRERAEDAAKTDPERALLALLDAYRQLRWSILAGDSMAYVRMQAREIGELETAHNRAVCGAR